MSLHDIDLKNRLSRFLGRKAAPRHLTAADAQADEIAALLRAVRRVAPRDPDALPGWWERFEDGLEERCGRNWPTVRDVCEAAAPAASASGNRPAEPGDIDTAVLVARRMRAREPVGQDWLFGLGACELIARGLVDGDLMKAYRSGAFHARARLYGQDAAQRWEAEAQARLDAAWPVWRARDGRLQKRDVEHHARTEPVAPA
jgi:hypothetical protein